MHSYDTFHLAPTSVTLSTPKNRGKERKDSKDESDESAKIAWAAKILSDYTRQKRRESYHDHVEQDIEEIRDSTQGEEETEDEEGDTFYQMCYMPIVLACILLGASLIGLVIYFVEDKPVVTTDNPVDERVTEAAN